MFQVSRFPWGDDPAAWLCAVADAAAEAGLAGLALMDHLIQIPQVGRAWEPIPEPWVALGLLAGRTAGLRLGTLVTPVTYRPAGVLAKTRLDQLEATIETLRALWQPGTKAHAGHRISLPETTCYPRPAAPVPIIVGGSGERRTLAIAARLGDGCNLPSGLAVLDRKLAVLRAHCAQAGRDPAEVEVTVLDVPVLGRDREHVAAIVEDHRGRTSAAAFA